MFTLAIGLSMIVVSQPANQASIRESDAIGQLRKLGAELYFEKQNGQSQLQCIAFDHREFSQQELTKLESALQGITATSFHASAGTMSENLIRAVSRIRGLEEVLLLTTAIENDHLKWLTSAAKLKRLRISFSQGLTTLAAIENNKVLIELGIPYNQIDDKGLTGLSKLVALEKLSLSSNKITDGGLAEVLRCSKLKNLDLSNTRITSGGIEKLVQLRHLEEIHLDWTKLADASFQRLCEMPSLKRIHIGFTDVTEGVIENIRRKRPKLDIVTGPQG